LTRVLVFAKLINEIINMENKTKKAERKIGVGELEYRRLRRREQQIIKVKRLFLEAYQILSQIEVPK